MKAKKNNDNNGFNVEKNTATAKIMEDLQNKKLIEMGEGSDDDGSDSNPSEDELPDEDII